MVWIITALLFVLKNIPYWLPVAVGVIGLIFTLMTAALFFSYYSELWFKDRNELLKLIEENRKEFEKTKEIIKVIGKHEAVKMWEENLREKENG